MHFLEYRIIIWFIYLFYEAYAFLSDLRLNFLVKILTKISVLILFIFLKNRGKSGTSKKDTASINNDRNFSFGGNKITINPDFNGPDNYSYN